MIHDGKVEIGVLNFLRGTNLENCYVILDEKNSKMYHRCDQNHHDEDIR